MPVAAVFGRVSMSVQGVRSASQDPRRLVQGLQAEPAPASASLPRQAPKLRPASSWCQKSRSSQMAWHAGPVSAGRPMR